MTEIRLSHSSEGGIPVSKPTTPRGTQRTSAAFTVKQLTDAWQELADTKAKSDAKKRVSGEKPETGMPVMRERKKSEQSLNLPAAQKPDSSTISSSSQTVTRTDTLVPPLALPRTQQPTPPDRPVLPKKLNFAADEKSGQKSSSAPHSPRTGKDLSDSLPRHRVNSAGINVSSSPRAEKSEEPTTPRETTVQKLKKGVSKKFQKAHLNLSSLSEKISNTVHSSFAPPLSAGRSSPPKISPRSIVSKELQDLPVRILDKAEEVYLSLEKNFMSDPVQAAKGRKEFNTTMTNVLWLNQLDASEKKLNALFEEAKLRTRNSVIDKEVDLEDPEFATFYEDAASAAFMKPWVHDGSTIKDVNGIPKGDVTKVKPTFIRDFDKSTYQVKNKDGSIRQLTSIDQFLDFVGSGKKGNLGMAVSNIASQNLGNFFKNALFLRLDQDKNSQSILRLSDGTPISPNAIFKATYTLSKDDGGNVIIDYQSDSQKKMGKPLFAVRNQEGRQAITVADDATIRITARVTIASDGTWHIGNPHVYAKSWHKAIANS